MTTLPDQATDEDAVFGYELPAETFVDEHLGATLTYSATLADGSPLPSWLTFDAATHSFSGTPANGDVGSLSIQVTATDTLGASASVSFGLVVSNVNDSPVVAATPADQAATEDAAFGYALPAGTFADEDLGDTLTYGATLADGSPLPSWLIFDAATHSFSGTPANGDVGSLSIQVTATDMAGASASVGFGIAVANVNDAPVVIAPPPDQAAIGDAPFSYVLPAGTFADEDLGDTLTYSATMTDGSPLPSWLTFDAATHSFSGMPTDGDIGSLSIQVTATDAAGWSASTSFAIAVAVDEAPVAAVAPTDQAATEDAAFSFALPAGTFTDANAGDTLTYSATLTDGSPLPSWLIFDAATHIFSGTPANGDVGSLSIQVTATDAAGASASTGFGIAIANVNDAPVVAAAPPDHATTAEGAFSYTLPAGTFADEDVGDTLTYGATLADGSALPSWLIFNAATGTFSGSPAPADEGSLSIRVTATDAAGATASTSFGIEIFDPASLTYADAKALIASAPSSQIILPPYLGDTTDNAYLKSYVTSAMCDYYGVSAEVFDGATLASTTLMRNFLNLALFFQDTWTDRASLDANGLTIASAFDDVASLLRYPATDSCGGTNFQLFEIYRAFGFDAAWVDSVNGVGGYTESHATVVVRVADIDKWIIQDSFENYLLVSPDGSFLSYQEARAESAAGTGDPVFDGLASYLDYQETGEGRLVTPANQETISNDIFSLPYNMVYSIGGHQYTYSTSVQFPNYPGAYNPDVSEGGVFATLEDAVASVGALHDSGLSWQAAANALRTDHYVTGFILRPGTDDASRWLTVRLADGQYVSVNYDNSQILNGTFEQLVFAASTGSGVGLGNWPADDFLGPLYVIGHDGFVVSDWDGRAVLGLNHAPHLDAVRYYAEAGQSVPLSDLFHMVDQDGDTATVFLAQVVGTDGAGGLVSDESGAVTSGYRFIPTAQVQDWQIDPGDFPAPSSIVLSVTDGISWSAPVAVEIGLTGVTDDLGGQYDWSTMRWYEYGGERERENYDLDNGGKRIVEYDADGAFDWNTRTTEQDAGAKTLFMRTAFDPGGGQDRIDTAIDYILSAGDFVRQLKIMDPQSTDPLTLTGNGLVNELTGNAGDNVLDGGGGGDRLIGLGGDDRYIVRDPTDQIVEAEGQGEDIVETTVSYALASGVSIERLQVLDVASTAALSLTGNQFGNRIEGNAGANLLNGGGGADQLIGHQGDDWYVVDNAGDVVIELAGEGFDAVQTNVDYVLKAGSSIEWLGTWGVTSTTPLRLTGNEIGNMIEGNAGANLLNGGGGADQMIGHQGDDWYVVDNAGDVVTELAGEGSDAVQTNVDYVLKVGSSIEWLGTWGVTSTTPLRLTGNELGNRIEGNAGANVLNGGGGADQLIGHQGDDWYVVDNAGDVVTELAGEGSDAVQSNVDYVLKAGSSIEWLGTWSVASTTPLRLTGNELSNIIEGNAGANVLNGGGGADQMIGHQGDDWYVVDNAGDVVTELAGEGSDAIQTNVDYILKAGSSIEWLGTWSVASTAALSLTGNELGNRIEGNAGANLLNGGGGADQLIGHKGDDWYVVDNSGDVVIELAGEGFDAVQTNVDYVLKAGSSIEWLGTWGVTSTTPLHLTGNELGNMIEGNAGANVLNGGGGADQMIGHQGDDWYVVDNAGDVVTELAGEGSDAVQTNVDYVLQAGSSIEWLGTWGVTSTTPLRLTGNELANTILGNAGDNVIDGKGGADQLFGYGGSDTFAFTSPLGAGNVDRIGDFEVGLDKIGLDDAIFSGLTLGALTPDAFRAGSTAQDADDRILYDPTTGALYFDADGAGGAAAVQFALLSPALNISASDFAVI